jgi:serine/threonine protein kinase
LNAEADLAARFAGEIRTLAPLHHPNIAQLHTALQVGNELVMMMEFVDGFTLQQLARQAPLPLKEVVDYVHQVLAALS